MGSSIPVLCLRRFHIVQHAQPITCPSAARPAHSSLSPRYTASSRPPPTPAPSATPSCSTRGSPGPERCPPGRHRFGGFMPSAACCSHTCLPRRNQRSCRSCSSSTDGCHLLFRMRRIASDDTSNLSASACVVYTSGNCALRARMPASASGERRLRGFQPSGNFFCNAAFCVCQLSPWRLGSDGISSLGVLMRSDTLSLGFRARCGVATLSGATSNVASDVLLSGSWSCALALRVVCRGSPEASSRATFCGEALESSLGSAAPEASRAVSPVIAAAALSPSCRCLADTRKPRCCRGAARRPPCTAARGIVGARRTARGNGVVASSLCT